MDDTPSAGGVTSTRPNAQQGDVDRDGEILDALKPSHRLMERERRLARCISGDTPWIERTQLENVMRALARVPA